MKIKIKTLSNKITEININNNYFIRTIKNRLQEMEGIEPDQQEIIFNNKILDDDTLINTLELNSNSILQLILAIRG
jgi:hypothetical protein